MVCERLFFLWIICSSFFIFQSCQQHQNHDVSSGVFSHQHKYRRLQWRQPTSSVNRRRWTPPPPIPRRERRPEHQPNRSQDRQLCFLQPELNRPPQFESPLHANESGWKRSATATKIPESYEQYNVQQHTVRRRRDSCPAVPVKATAPPKRAEW